MKTKAGANHSTRAHGAHRTEVARGRSPFTRLERGRGQEPPISAD
jgi:hypothetical protein